MITRMLTSDDEYLHQPTTDPTWNESRYVDFYDSTTNVGGWLRMGMRPNQQHCEASACLYLPDGRVTFSYQRSSIENNGTEAGGQIWNVGDPYRRLTASFAGPMIAMADPWQLLQPKTAFATNPRVHAEIDLQLRSEGLPAVMGSDQAHIDTIFLPGQADWHFQQLCWTSGTIQVDEQRFDVTGRGGRDRSWGPRNWLAKIYLRWFTASTDDDEFGFMLLRAVGPTKSTRGGHVWDGGEFFLVDDFEMRNTFSERSPHELQQYRSADPQRPPPVVGDGHGLQLDTAAPRRPRPGRCAVHPAHRQVADDVDLR